MKKTLKKKQKDYEYVFVTIYKGQEPSIIGVIDLDTLTGIICSVCSDKDVKFRAFTRAHATKLKLIPTITCMGPAKKKV